MDAKKVLVIGSKGMLGTDLVELLQGNGLSPITADIDEIDITDGDSVERFFGAAAPDVVINCAAFTNVDGCESQQEAAFAVNARGPELLAQACDARGARLVHVSTDYVFDGAKNSPYLPDDPPNPAGVYGKSKLQGERAILANCPDSLIVRTAWLYGARGKNFVCTMLRLAQEKPELQVVADQIGSPTYTVDLAHALESLAFCDATGITHATNAGQCSWCDFAREIIGLAGLSTPVKALTTAEYPTPARRPAWSVLDCSRTERLTGVPMRHWREALAEFIEKLQLNA